MTVEALVRFLAAGMTHSEILEEWPEIEKEDIKQALAYAAWPASERVLEGGLSGALSAARRNSSTIIGQTLSEGGVRATHVRERQLANALDEAIVEHARNHEEVLVSHDVDFIRILAASGATRCHPGTWSICLNEI